MKSSLTTLGAMVLAAGLVATPERAAAGGSEAFVVPQGGLILDGGDAEANPFLEGPAPAAAPAGPVASSLAALDAQPAPAPRPIAFEYSDGYYTRLKVHKWASFATLPLFATQVVLGQKLYNGDASDSVRSAHNAVAAGTGVLFGVNTVTGVWNMIEGRKDPSRKTKVKVHGLLMLLADAGFAATGFMAPSHENEGGFESSGGVSQSTHRAIALSSMGVATAAYLVMLLGH
jgi:hypothetical protein